MSVGAICVVPGALLFPGPVALWSVTHDTQLVLFIIGTSLLASVVPYSSELAACGTFPNRSSVCFSAWNRRLRRSRVGAVRSGNRSDALGCDYPADHGKYRNYPDNRGFGACGRNFGFYRRNEPPEHTSPLPLPE